MMRNKHSLRNFISNFKISGNSKKNIPNFTFNKSAIKMILNENRCKRWPKIK